MVHRREYEIKQFMLEIEELIKVSKNIKMDTSIKFDPYIFMLWRLCRKNGSIK